MIWVIPAIGQRDYFRPEVKNEGLAYFQKNIYAGCAEVKEKQDTISTELMRDLVQRVSSIVEENFSRSFADNPKVLEVFKKDLKGLSLDPSCQELGNNCRAQLLSIALYYYQQLRPDIPDCQNYVSVPSTNKAYSNQCEVEQKYRKSNFQGVSSGYGLPGIGSYRKELVAIKDNTTVQLFKTIMHKDGGSIHICNTTKQGDSYTYNLKLDNPGNNLQGLEPASGSVPKVADACVDEKKVLLTEFLPTDFDKGRNEVGLDQVEPLKLKILEFSNSDPQLIITDISVSTFGAKVPNYILKSGKKIIDPDYLENNLNTVKLRSLSVSKVLAELKSSSSKFSSVTFTTVADLAGPDFEKLDLNDRFVTKMTSGYAERVESMYNKNKKLFNEQALVKSHHELMDEKKIVNLYQAKYKPFQGFKVEIKGVRKDESKCLNPKLIPNSSPSSVIKQ